MKITRATVRGVDVPLTRPYAVANHATDTASMVLVRLEADGPLVGLGAATPEPAVNGDTRDAALAQLQQSRFSPAEIPRLVAYESTN